MVVQINKSNLYIGFASNFACTPIIAKSEKQVLLDLEDEIYRTCNWLNKKPPKDIDNFKSNVKTVNCSDSDIEFFENGEFFKGEFDAIKLSIIQGLFSYKCMVESTEQYGEIDKLTNLLNGIYLSIVGDNYVGGFLETGFKTLEILEESKTLDSIKLKAYAYKILYVIVSTAKEFYLANKDKFKDITNSFCF